MNTLSRIVPTALAILCALAFLPWILGVPGTENDYATGWAIGFYALISYLGFYGLVLVLRLLTRLGWLPLENLWLNQVLLAAVACFAVAQVVAWTFILR